MRVVFLTHNYPRHSGDVAGAFLAPLAAALLARGHEVRVVAPSDGGRGGRDVVDGVSVRRVRYASAGGERYAYTGRMAEAVRSPAGWLALARLHRAFRRAARDEAAGAGEVVIHAHWWFPAGLAAPPELPTVVTLHGTDGRLLGLPVARWLARRALKGRVVTSVSRAVAEAAAQVTGRPIETIGVQPMPLRQPLHQADRLSRGAGGLVVVARLTGQKRIHLALEAHRLLQRAYPGLPLTIVGDGPERQMLERRTRELGTDQTVRWLGEVAPDAVPGAIGDADVAFVPAYQEGFGLAALEAMGQGVPVVACRDGGGLLDIFSEPGAGEVVEPTGEAIAAAARRLLEQPDARAGAARAAAPWRARLDPRVVAERFEGWYREARGE